MTVRALPLQTHLIEVRLRPEFLDAEGQAALALLQGQGLTSLKDCRVSRVYEIKGPISANQALQAAKDLLCDPVTQEFRALQPAAPAMNGMNFWRVEVWPKPTVTDPAGDTVRAAIADLGLPKPESVRCATVYQITNHSHRVLIKKAVTKSLGNPLIHRFVVSEAHP